MTDNTITVQIETVNGRLDGNTRLLYIASGPDTYDGYEGSFQDVAISDNFTVDWPEGEGDTYLEGDAYDIARDKFIALLDAEIADIAATSGLKVIASEGNEVMVYTLAPNEAI
jgi:hypothetical protein